VSAASPSGDDGGLPDRGRPPSFAVVVLIVSLTLLLMGFSVCAVLLNQPTLAAVAGSAAVGLAAEMARRVLPAQVSARPGSRGLPAGGTESPESQ
jgi:hypothetical protein